MSADVPSSRLDYEIPPDRAGQAMGSLTYVLHHDTDRGVTITAPYTQPIGRGWWIQRAAIVFACVALGLLALGSFGGPQVRYAWGLFSVAGNRYAVWGWALFIAAVLLQIPSRMLARRRRQRVTIEATSDRLLIRMEALADGEQEAHVWPREDLTTILSRGNGGGVSVINRAGKPYVLGIGKTSEERDWLADTLRETLNLPGPTSSSGGRRS